MTVEEAIASGLAPHAEGLSVEDHGSGIALLWLDRPEHGNAFTYGMQRDLQRLLTWLDDRQDVRAIVVAGRGERFSVGADLSQQPDSRADPTAAKEQMRLEIAAARRAWDMDTPIIAAINGAAVGLGLTLPLQWDIRIVDEDAKLGFVFTRRGMTPELNATWLLPRIIGASSATDLLLTGRLFSGREAVTLGLAAEAVPKAMVVTRALEVARDIADHCAPAAVSLTKKLLNAALDTPDRELAWTWEWETFLSTARSGDVAEGAKAFMERRPAIWKRSKNAGALHQALTPWAPPQPQ